MISGTVNEYREAVIPLLVIGASSREQLIEAIVDTGFTGHLTLPSSIIAALRLAWSSRQHGLLADGKVVLFDIYSASVMWDGQPRTVRVAAADTRPLLGMSMLARHSLMIDVVSGGAVSITALP